MDGADFFRSRTGVDPKKGKPEDLFREAAFDVYKKAESEPCAPEARRGNFLLFSNQRNKAVDAYRSAVDDCPSSSSSALAYAYAGLANAFASEGKFHKAESAARAAYKLDSHAEYILDEMSKILVVEGKQDEAIAELKKGLREDVRSAVLHNALGNALLSEKKRDDAVSEYRMSIQLDPRDAVYPHDKIASVFAYEGNERDAIAEYNAALQIDKRDAYAFAGLAAISESQGKPDEAIALYRQAIRSSPMSVDIRTRLSQALMSEKKWDEAEREYRAATVGYPQNAAMHAGFAAMLIQNADSRGQMEWRGFRTRSALQAAEKRTNEEMKNIKDAIRLDPYLAPPHILLSGMLIAQGKRKAALDEFHAGVKLNPYDPGLHFYFAKSLFDSSSDDSEATQLQDVSLAVKELREATKLGKYDPQTHFMFGSMLMALEASTDKGMYKSYKKVVSTLSYPREGIDEVYKAIQLDPRNASSYHEKMGYFFDQMDKPNETVSEYRKAMEINPDMAKSGSNFIEQIKNTSVGIAILRQAARMYPQDVELQVDIGASLANDGKYVQAINEFHAILARDSKAVSAHAGLADVFLRKGELLEAVKEFKKTILNEKDKYDHVQRFFVNGFIQELASDRSFQEKYTLSNGTTRPVIQILQMSFLLGSVQACPHESYLHAQLASSSLNPDAAMDEWKEAIRLSPHVAFFHDGAAYALRTAGKKHAADVEFHNALRLDPNDNQAKQGLCLNKGPLGDVSRYFTCAW